MKQTMLVFLSLLIHACAGGEVPTKNRGGCLVIYLRGNPVSSSVENFCDRTPVNKFPNGDPFQKVYSWVPPLLAYSFDQAERANCGSITCATQSSKVTLFLISNGMPNAAVSMTNDQIILLFTTGLVDFIDATSRRYLADIDDGLAGRPENNGYVRMMAAMQAAGGRPCTWQFLPPESTYRPDFMKVQEFAQGTYQVVFGHELAHYLSQDHASCGGKPPGLAREMACDATSVKSLLRQPDSTMNPINVVATLMALDSYSRIAGPAGVGFFEGGDTAAKIQEEIASLPWHTRAAQVVDLWDSYCRSGANSKVCPVGFDGVIVPARELAETPGPKACVP